MSNNDINQQKINTSQSPESNDSAKNSNSEYSFAEDLFLIALATGIVWLAVAYLTNFPRLSFWTISPVIALVIAAEDRIHKFLKMLIFISLIFWGWEMHHLNKDGHKYEKKSSNTQPYYKKQNALSNRALKAKEYVDSLPWDQKQALLGAGDPNAEANATANLIKSGHLEGWIEYQQSLK